VVAVVIVVAVVGVVVLCRKKDDGGLREDGDMDDVERNMSKYKRVDNSTGGDTLNVSQTEDDKL